jgi:primary-amine oxidase
VNRKINLCAAAAALGTFLAALSPSWAELRQEAPTTAKHPMDAITADEIRSTKAILQKANKLDDASRFVSVSLDENPKSDVRAWKPGQPFARRAFAVILKSGRLYEARVDLGARSLVSFEEIANRQAGLTVEEMMNAADLPKKDPRWQAALAKRGITSFDKVECFPLAAGPVNDPAMAGRRLLNVPCVDASGATNNLWGKPIEGVLATVDLAAGTVLSVTDLGVVPAPTEPASQAYEDSDKYRAFAKPVEIAAPQGSNVAVDGGSVRWDNWSFHLRMDPRLGAMLSLIRYDDHGTWRDIIYQLSPSEMYVPYMSPDQTWSFRAYMDIGEYGFGALASHLHPGADCPATATYLDMTISDSKGDPLGQRGVVCIFERPTGAPLWRHEELANGTIEVRPNVELVVRTAPVVGNYDYIIDYVFDRAGGINVRLGAYGIDATKGVAATKLSDPSATQDTMYGSLISSRLIAVNHDHYMSFRLDMDVDGTENRLVEDRYKVEMIPDTQSRKSLWRVQNETVSVEGPIDIPLNAAQFRVESSTRTNKLGYPTSYQLMAEHTATSILSKEDAIQKRAAFSDYTLWASAYAPNEKYSSGTYPNQNPRVEGLPAWVAAKRPIKDRDLVVWYTVGFRHIPRTEDWPAMPALWHGFGLRPFNFYDRNPGLDVPPADVRASKQ